MHTVVFHMKRAFQSTLRVTRPLFQELRITPARFDMMRTLERGERFQTDLLRVLGVSAMTVSRMVRALERLGLVVRRTPYFDRRRRIVELTDEGRALLRRASRLIVWSGTVERLLLDELAPDRRMHRELRRIHAFDGMDRPLWVLARGFGDTAWPPYPPWHPDD
jgi:DNA-binding MarR family transcriptional regulator